MSCPDQGLKDHPASLAPSAPKGSKASKGQRGRPVLQALPARQALKARPVRTAKTQTQPNFTPNLRWIFVRDDASFYPLAHDAWRAGLG